MFRNFYLGKELHGVHVDLRVLLDLEVLHLDRHLPPVGPQGRPVHLRQARTPQRPLVKRREYFRGLQANSTMFLLLQSVYIEARYVKGCIDSQTKLINNH